MNNLIDYSEHDFTIWQAEREGMRQDIERLARTLALAAEHISTTDMWFGTPVEQVLQWLLEQEEKLHK